MNAAVLGEMQEENVWTSHVASCILGCAVAAAAAI